MAGVDLVVGLRGPVQGGEGVLLHDQGFAWVFDVAGHEPGEEQVDVGGPAPVVGRVHQPGEFAHQSGALFRHDRAGLDRVAPFPSEDVVEPAVAEDGDVAEGDGVKVEVCAAEFDQGERFDEVGAVV